MPNSLIQTGVTGFHSDLLGCIDFFEINAHDLTLVQNTLKRLELKPNLIINANHFYFSHHDPAIFHDRIATLAEGSARIGALKCILKLPPSFLEKLDSDQKLVRFKKIWLNHTSIPFMIEHPKNAPRFSSIKSINQNQLLNDPFWERPCKASLWKIHGWNDERWIRFYAPKKIRLLVKWAIKHQPSYVLFSHSQRKIQALEFRRLLLDSSS